MSTEAALYKIETCHLPDLKVYCFIISCKDINLSSVVHIQMTSPPRPFSLSPSVTRWLPVAIFLLALGARLLPGARTIDDSYITYRYVRNILAGNGFTYNPGERVLGTTTPLYTFLLSGIGFFSGGEQAPLPQISLLVNALADGVTCLLLLRLGRKLGFPLAGVATALVWAIAPFSVTFAIGGLETSLYVLLLTATVLTYLEQKLVAAAFLGALALLTRPDALILLGPLAVDRVLELSGIGARLGLAPRQPRGTPWKELVAFGVPVLLWLAFSGVYFGSPLPHSIAAKSVAYRLPPESAFTRLLQHYAVPFMGNQTFGTWWIGVGLILGIFLYLVGARNAFKNQPHAWPYLAYPWLYFITFALANPLIFRWYLTPPLPAYMLLILAGAERLVLDLVRLRNGKSVPATAPNQRRLPGVLAAIFVVVIPLLLISQDWVLRPDHGLQRPAPSMAWYQLELLYRQAADSLADQMSQSATPPVLAAGDVGVLGYYTPARILDTVGLNSPQSTSYYPLDEDFYVISYAVPPDLILDQMPDYVVILEVYGRQGLLIDPRFQQAYRLRQKIPTDIYGSDGMLIYELRD